MHERNILERIQQNTGHHKRVTRNGADISKLAANLDTNAVQRTRVLGAHAIERRHPLLRKDTREEGPHHAADTVQLEDIHTLVDAEPRIHILAARAHNARQEADQARNPGRHVTRSRRNTDQTSDGTRAGTDDGEAAFGADVVDEDPAEDAEGGGDMGVEGGSHGADRSIQGRAAVEAEPAEPDEDGAEEDEGRVVRLAVDGVAFVFALAEDEGVGEGAAAGGDVDGAAAGEVEGGEVEEPAILVL